MSSLGQHPGPTITTPVRGGPKDADVVRGHLQNLSAPLTAHDADRSIHVLAGPIGSRPAAGVEGSLYIQTDGGAGSDNVLWYDNGSTWEAFNYSDPTHVHTFASLTSKPTTLAGYGISDAAAATHTHVAADITGVAVKGGSALSTTNRLAKVSSAGTVGESTITEASGIASLTTQPRARVRSTTTSIPNTDVLTAASWSVEDVDVGAMVDLAGQPTRITVPTGGDGCYLCAVSLSFNASTTGTIRAGCLVNGTLTPSDEVRMTGVSGLVPTISWTVILELTAGQYVQAAVAQNGSGSISLLRGFMSLVKLW